MEWSLLLLLIFGSLVILLLLGLPVVMVFMLICGVGAFLLWRGGAGLELFTLSLMYSVTKFSYVAVLMFILMGELMFNAEIAPQVIDALDKWLGRLPGRLSLLAVIAGTIFAVLTGASIASTAMLGSTLVPEMEKRGYKPAMSFGPILGSGGLAIMIPPSGLAVLLGALAEVSVGRILIGIIVPGLLMAFFYALYTIGRCWLQPEIAPPYGVAHVSWSEKLSALVKYILPTGFIVFLVIGVILLGVATPTEAAATGTLGMFIMAVAYRRMSWKVAKRSALATIKVSVMVLVIIAGATTYSEILAFSGATSGLIKFAIGLPMAPLTLIASMLVLLVALGCFMPVVAIMMLAAPLLVPIVIGLGFDPVWFLVMFLLAMETGVTTPPFGVNLFVMKGIAPGATMQDLYLSALPYVYCDLLVIALILAFPLIALWLPSLMR